MEELLTTKLYIPSTRPGLVHRARLIEQLDAGLHRKLTLISAPAGFGKTTLVTEWLDNLRGDSKKEKQIDTRIAWLSLDEGDNDPVRFLSYFITALNQVEGKDTTFGKGALSMLQSPQPLPSEAILTSLINEFAELTDKFILVLDDYHLIETQPIHDALAFLLEHLPSQLHLVLATREDPHLPLSRLRASGQLSELRATDLRFTFSEVAEFLNHTMGLELSTEDIAVLETRTEGWIAGLQLAAISIQGREDAANLIKSFTGSHRLVLDYLIEEVLSQQAESVQDFLLQTSILNRLNGLLCDALTGQDDGQATLEMLDHSNLFIVALDEKRRWYRFHHLFSDLLFQRLKQIQPGQLPNLHQRASDWYAQNGFVDEAIEHALQGGDFIKAAQLIEEHFDVASDDTKLFRWLGELPVEIISSNPRLCIFHARHLFTNGQMKEAEQALLDAEHAFDPRSNEQTGNKPIEQDQQSDFDREVIIGMTAVIRAFLAIYQGNIQETIDYSRQALNYLPEQDVTWRSLAAMPLGDANMFKGDIAAAYDVRMESLDMSKKSGNPYLILKSNGRATWTLRQQGKLKRVIELCEQHMQYANQCGISQTLVAGWIMTIWGEALAELNDLAGAIQKAKKGVELIGSGSGNLALFGWGNLNLVKILFSKGDISAAKEVIQRMEEIVQEFDMHRLASNRIFAWKARIWLEEDEFESASKWVEEFYLNASENLTLISEIECIVLARSLIAQDNLDEATKLMRQLLSTAEAGNHTSRIIKILILQAMNFQAGEDITQALTALERALALAESDGFIHTFVDEGPPIEALLKRIKVEDGKIKAYVRTLLSAFSEKVSHPSSLSPQPLIEPLSERELEVLHLITEGLTNQEIATRLFLTLNTIKTHTRNIYSKLGVNNRTQAAAKARDLGILPPT